MDTLSDLDADLQLVRSAVEQKQPLAQWISSIIRETDELIGGINCQAYRFLSKDEMLEALEIDENDLRDMCTIATRLQFIASNIESRTAPKFKLVGHPRSR